MRQGRARSLRLLSRVEYNTAGLPKRPRNLRWLLDTPLDSTDGEKLASTPWQTARSATSAIAATAFMFAVCLFYAVESRRL